ncbi:HAMP domain-containing protein [Microcoleus sp. FACHB-831]|uniref:sensor histidine kinase n=1 Tax=Microcoleus sp. FACHB-831 TaxID=2692827 RepID=UPI0016884A0D|nr:ATP-binding protein [Microcoleus sp. FACHB-831]MBD1921789.1 HAMP domain-containing protein [Microcoleus sp. FACHB-831]
MVFTVLADICITSRPFFSSTGTHHKPSICTGARCQYTSRAIARPIRAVTHVAQRATQESNFDLQAPVSSEDEVGALTASLNLLILKVSQLLEEQKAEAQATLMQSEKMSSLGRMMAGVAHEINNPVNFIYGNTIHASEYIKELLELLETYQCQVPNPPQAVTDIAEEIDIEFLKEDLPKLLDSMKFGAERAKAIVLSLKDFSRLDEVTPNLVDLHGCIDSSLLILNSRIKKGINVVRSYGDIPAIEGYAGLLYQVFMNLMSNAIDAIEETKNPISSGLLAITTQRLDQDWVVVRIADSGSGITSENQAKIFDAFFTTKPRGVGTGLGLSISHQIIVEKHGGKLSCQSEVGVGTSFAIALPIKHTPVAPVAASQLIRHLA